MDTVGWVAIVMVALIALIGVIIGVRSIPDIQRYIKMRHM